MKKGIFFLSIGFFLCLSSVSFAQMLLDKREIKLEISPEEQLTDSITVSNPTNKDVTVKAYLEDFTYAPPYLGLKTLLPLGSTERSCGKWFNVSLPMFIIPAKTSREVKFTISVPKEAKGGYYAVLFFEKGEVAISAEKGVGIVEKTGCSLFLETKDKEKNAKIGDILASDDSITGSLTNYGNVILISQGTFYIMDDKDIVTDRGQINKFYLPPEATAPFKVRISKQVIPGNYTLVINFDLEDGKILIKEVDFKKDNTGKITISNVRD